MGATLIYPAAFSLRPRTCSLISRSSPPPANPQIASSFSKYARSSATSESGFRARAVLSKFPNERTYPIGAMSAGPIPAAELLEVVELAAKTGAEVVMDAVNKPRNISYKGVTDLVTDTDKMSESAILDVVRKNFKNHLILGEEGGLIGDTSSDYLWCIDPLDGTTNFAHCYPSFGVSVGVLLRGRPVAAAVVEFVGGPMCWNTRTFTATSGGGAFCNGQKIHVSQTDQIYDGVNEFSPEKIDNMRNKICDYIINTCAT